MSLDVVILRLSLVKLAQSTVQQMLDTICLPAFGDIYLDHADVISVVATVDHAKGVANFDAAVNIFIVDKSSLLANANGTPPGALSPYGQGNVQLQLSVTGTVISLACTDVTSSDSSLNAVAAQLKSLIPPAPLDLAPVFSGLGLPPPTSSTVDEAKTGSFVIRFDPSGGPVDHLQAGQDWCLFLDAETTKGIILTKVSKISSYLTGVATSAVWAPSGSVPHVNVNITGHYPLSDPLSAGVELDLAIDFVLQSSPKALEEIVDWNVSVFDLGLLSLFESEILSYINGVISSSLGAFGATPIGPNEFSLSQPLPLLAFNLPGSAAKAVFSYGSVTGLSDGMVLGGPITGIPAISTNTTTYSVNGFPSQFVVVTDCLSGGKVGTVTLTSMSVAASASFVDAGNVCSVTILSPPTSTIDLNPYLSVALSPPTGISTSAVITMSLTGLVSAAVLKTGQPVRILVNTSRGVREIDFGLPPNLKLDSGKLNYKVIEIWDCPGNPSSWTQIFHSFNPKWNVDPYEWWVDNIEQAAMFSSSLIELTGLQPGELITFNQPMDGGLAAFSASQTGQLTVPAVLAVRSFDAEATLSRVNRSALGGVVQRTMLFERVVVLETPGALSHSLTGDAERAVITSSFADRTESIHIDSLGIPMRLGTQALDVARMAGHSMARASEWGGGNHRNEVPGLVRMRTVPGFEEGPISVAELDDGTYLVLSQESQGSVRVAGTVPRWPDMPPISGRWAISSSKGDRVAVFKVRRLIPPSQCSCCGEKGSPGETLT